MESEVANRIESCRAALTDLFTATRPTGRQECLDAINEIDVLTAMLAGQRLDLIRRAELTGIPGQDSLDQQLHATHRCNIGPARADIRLANDLDLRYPILGEALKAGTISKEQATAIVKGLKRLRLNEAQTRYCQETMLAYAKQFDPDDLHTLALRMMEVLDPQHFEELELRKLEREAWLAFQRRHLSLYPDHHGSMQIRGSLPVADGELLLAQLESLKPTAVSYHEATGDAPPEKAARMADALISWTHLMAGAKACRGKGGDRPRVVVTMPHQGLLEGLTKAEVIADGTQLAPSEARLLACDSDLLPMVLGAASRPLDVGRTHRYFTEAISLALAVRDRGCAFPGCDIPPAACHRHHIQPWRMGGHTSIDDGVLLCPFHHRLTEPDPDPNHFTAAKWKVHIDPDTGRPWFTPPPQVDRHRQPLQNQRYETRGTTLPKIPAQPVPDPADDNPIAWLKQIKPKHDHSNEPDPWAYTG